jgi:hypothetical protein
MFFKFFGWHPPFWLNISSSWVKIWLHTENQLPGLSGSGLNVCVMGKEGELDTNYVVTPTHICLSLAVTTMTWPCHCHN